MSPPNSNPPSPHYSKTAGRLVTDRYDFQDHIEGNNFKHDADQIDLLPPVTITNPITNQNTTLNNVYDAVQNISAII